ncbi:MAG: response regulator, partial [Nitrosopumilus sp.]
IHTCTDPKSAMSEFSKLCNSNTVPLVFLDYYLPDTDTISLFKEILKMEPKTKIIIETVAEKEEYGIKYLTQHGAYHYIQKPFSFENIKELMETFEKEHYV